MQVLWGTCRDAPYASLVEALSEGLTPLRAAQRARLVDPPLLAALSPLIPALADLIPLPSLIPLDPAGEKARLHQALAHYRTALGQVAPHLLVLEDWQWMDPATPEVLPVLAAHLPGTRVLLVGTARGGEPRGRPEVWEQVRTLDRSGVLERFTLVRLSTCETGDLIRRLLGSSQTMPDLSRRVYVSTQGNPSSVLSGSRIWSNLAGCAVTRPGRGFSLAMSPGNPRPPSSG